jgi:uncharacterized protein with von Willebrand factor type A (vWA) domain
LNDPEQTTELSPQELAEQAERSRELKGMLSDGIEGDLDDEILVAEKTLQKKKEIEPPSPYALRTDGWERMRGREIATTNERMKKAEIDEIEATDFHASCYNPQPELHPNCKEPLRTEYMKQLFETVEYMELHDKTMGDDFSSEIAATQFGEAYAALRKQKNDIDRENAQREAKGQGPKTGPGSKPNVIGAVAKGLSKASQAVEEMQDACDAMGMGAGKEQGANTNIDPTRIVRMMKKISSSQTLKNIMKWAGRFKVVASSCQREKVTYGNDEVVGVKPDDDVSKLLPQELAMLNDDDLAPLFYARYLEKQTLCRDYMAREPKGRGPIVVIIDESGSMGGTRIETAKGMLLAIGWVARKQKRWMLAAAFSSSRECRMEVFPNGGWDEAKMMKWLESFYGGGTELEGPLRTVPKFIDGLVECPRGKMDFIIITDDDVSCSNELKESFMKWKKENKVLLKSIMISSYKNPRSALVPMSDEVYYVNEITTECDATIAAFSI